MCVGDEYPCLQLRVNLKGQKDIDFRSLSLQPRQKQDMDGEYTKLTSSHSGRNEVTGIYFEIGEHACLSRDKRGKRLGREVSNTAITR